ncbi:MAG TPA: HEPN domain-containing protein [Mucilaginibacter sp.]|jgi:HEPN domain-containing protein|nr:HEPN domain-containing protein [Mucilaginibacter sp.]
MTPALLAYVNSWINKAEHDLISAQRLLEIEPMILDNACFHCQQAIEKLLKAFLIYHGQDVERTHNIIFLLSECANFDPVFGAIDPLDINTYAVQGRYPDSNLMPSKEEAESYYQLALEIKSLTNERIIFS